MTQQIINIGIVADDGTGDVLRTAFDKTNANFTELYASVVGTIARRQRTVLTSPIVVQASDQIITCRIPTPASCALPSAASRNGVPITFKDLGFASANSITLTPLGIETIDGATFYVLRNNYAWATLVPFTDGLNIGWMIA